MSIDKYLNLAKNELFHLNRSISGAGINKTLNIIKKKFPNLKIRKIKSGTKAFDWIVPPEWNVKEAYILDKFGNKIVDIKNNNLHLISYSKFTNIEIDRDTLFKKLHYLKKQPDAIPYLTSYYNRDWGFCVSYKFFKSLRKNYKKYDKFRIFINANHDKKGSLRYGELLINNKNSQEILISTYICHPSMANNELSGPIVSMALIEYFQKVAKKLNKKIRFLFIPETIGSIIFLSKNLNYLKKNVIGGYNLTCIGDERQHSCLLSKKQNSASDESLIESYKKHNIKNYKIYSFLRRGSDERQYNSPGIDLPITSIFRSKYVEYPEYHTSLDNFRLVTKKGLTGGYDVAKTAIILLDKKIIPKFKILCEPQLGRRNLYPKISKKRYYYSHLSQQILDFLQYADGKNSLNKICELININMNYGKKLFRLLVKNKILE